MTEGLPEDRRVTIDCDSVAEAINYDPNDDLEDTSELIQRGFLSQREAEGLESEENDLDPDISHNKRETLKALANIQVKFRTEHFKSKDEADKASSHLKALHEIFLGMNDPIASTVHTPPRASSRASSRATSPEPTLAMDVGLDLDEMSFVNVTLDENPASPPAASPSAAPPSAASPSAAGMDDKSNTSDVDLDVSQRFGEADVRASTSAASAAAAAAVTSYLEEIEVSRFTPLEPRATSSSQTTGRTSPVSIPSTSVATSSKQQMDRPRRQGTRKSTYMYTEYSSEDLSTTGEESFDPEA